VEIRLKQVLLKWMPEWIFFEQAGVSPERVPVVVPLDYRSTSPLICTVSEESTKN
jgi:hypothetical protein